MIMEVQPPLESIHGGNHSNIFPRPPITPYDLSVLLTTIVLGIAKAVTASVGATIAPTTLEWLGSVVIFLALYVIGWYKSSESKAAWMDWFFSAKSRHFPHNLRKPTLDSINKAPASEAKNTPIVTGNRIFVTISVISFGVSKAFVTYRGLPTPANTLDWVFAIVVSSLTYCLDMYQDEAPEAWPSAFQTDYQFSLYSVPSFLGMTFMLLNGLFVTSFWIIASGYSFVFLWNWAPEEPPMKLLLPPFLDYIHFISCKILVACLATVILAELPIMMEMFTGSRDIGFLWRPLKLIRQTILVLVGFISRFSNAISPAISSLTAWRFTWRFCGSLGQVVATVLLRVGVISFFQTTLITLPESSLIQQIIQIYKRTNFVISLRLLFTSILTIVSLISSIGLWTPTTALHALILKPFVARLMINFVMILTSVLSGVSFVGMLDQLNDPTSPSWNDLFSVFSW